MALCRKDCVTSNSIKILLLQRSATKSLWADIPSYDNKNIVLGPHCQAPHHNDDSHQKMLSEIRKAERKKY